MTPPESGNCVTDAVQFLTKFSDLKNIKIKMKLINDINKDQLCDTDYLSDLDLSSINIQNILMEDHQACAIGYVTGWVCGKLTYSECIQNLAATSDRQTEFSLDNTHIDMKAYENAKLLFPFKNTLEYSKKVTCIFNLNIERFLLENKFGIRKEIIKIIDLACRKPGGPHKSGK